MTPLPGLGTMVAMGAHENTSNLLSVSDAGQSDRWPGMRILGYSAALLSTLLLLAWPFFLFMSAFIFDAPLKGLTDEILRFSLAFYALSYPLGYLAGIAYVISRKTGQPKGRVWWTKWGVFLFFLPCIQVGLIFLFYLVTTLVG